MNTLVERLNEATKRVEMSEGVRLDFSGSREPLEWNGVTAALLREAATALSALTREVEEAREVLTAASAFRFPFLNESSLDVVSRGDERWAVLDGGRCYTRDGGWEYEPLPSSRTEEFIARTRYTLSEALSIARVLSRDSGEGEKT